MNNRIGKNCIPAILSALALGGISAAASAQLATPRLIESGPDSANNPFGIQAQKLTYLNKDGTPTERGKTCSEILRGNGTRAGYTLTHGGVIPNTVRVSVGARSLRVNQDYYLDAANGALFFTESVRRGSSVYVSYRYVEGKDGARSPGGIPGLALSFNGTNLNFAYGISSSGGSGPDFTTYGLSMNSRLGGGSSLNGLLYFSTPAETNNNLVGNPGDPRAKASRKADTKDGQTAKNDHLIVQNLDLKAGAANFKVRYQDIGKSFNGFQAMKQANASSADVLQQIGLLEKERGINRLGFGAGLKAGKKDDLGFDWDQIDDGKDKITRRAFSFKTPTFNFGYRTQSVGAEFSQFQGLREAEAGQWAREKGVQRSELTLGLSPAKGMAFNYQQNQIGDKSGSVSRQAIEFASNRFSFLMTGRKADAKFERLKDLGDADKTALALDIQRQFNPNATAAQVSAKDKEQIVADAGLERSQTAFTLGLAKSAAFAYNRFSIQDENGGIERQSYRLDTKRFAFSYLDQRISDKFERLGKMSDFERARFANERGMHRNELAFNWALNKTSTFAFSQLGLDDKDAGMMRQSFALNLKGFEGRYNVGRTDFDFKRASDLALSDPEKKNIEEERGFSRSDYALRLTAIKGLSVDTYRYDAGDSARKRARAFYRDSLAWMLNRNTQVNYLSEGHALSQENKTQDGRAHTLLTVDSLLKRNMKFNYLLDNLATTAGGTPQPDVSNEFLHFETDRAKPNNLMAERRALTFSNGKFENTQQMDVNGRASKTLSWRFNKLEIARGLDRDAIKADPKALPVTFVNTDTHEIKWQTTKTLAFAAANITTRTNDKKDVDAQSYSLIGMLAKNLNFTGTYADVHSKGQNLRMAKELALSNPTPTNILGLRQATVTLRHASLVDQKKLQSETVGGSVKGFLGKHQIGVEYGGSADPKGNSAVSRALTFVSDPGNKQPIKIDLLYKARNVNRSDLNLVRRYNVAWKMDRAMTASYVYASLPEDPNGNMVPTKSSAFTLKRALTRLMNMSVEYITAKDLAKKTATSKLAFLLNGQVNPLTAVQVGYSVDVSDQPGSRSDTHTVTLGYDFQADGDHFFTISASYAMPRSSQPDTLQTNFDFKTRF